MLIDELKEKAKRGDAEAQYELGNLYSYGDETEGAYLDFKEALKWYKRSAKRKYVPAINAVGFAYRYGEGVKQNVDKAFKLYKKAAEANDVWALHNIALLYESGKIVKKDLDKAELYFKKVFLIAEELAEKGDVVGQSTLAAAQTVLGCCYDFGRGTRQDYEKAVYWYEKAANSGNRRAQNNLGACYEFGTGVKCNSEKALYWYKKAAERGYAQALKNLGIYYENGNGLEKNYEKAVEYYRKAAERGNESAQCYLGECYENGNGVEQNYEEAVKWYTLSAESGCDEAQYHLAECYRYGRGVKENIKRAIKWYKKAAEQDYLLAEIELAELNEKRNKKQPTKEIEEDYIEYVTKEIEKSYIDEHQLLNEISIDNDNTVLENEFSYQELIRNANDTTENTDFKKEEKSGISGQLEEIKASIAELNDNVLTSGLIGNPLLGELGKFFKREKEILEKSSVLRFLSRQERRDLIYLDSFIGAAFDFLEVKKGLLTEEITNKWVEFNNKKGSIPDDNDMVIGYIKKQSRALSILKKDVGNAKSFSDIIKCEERYEELKKKTDGSIRQWRITTDSDSTNEDIKYILESKITELRKKKTEIEKMQKNNSLGRKRKESMLCLCETAENVLHKRLSEFEPDKGRVDKESFRKDVSSQVNNFYSVVEQGVKAIDNAGNEDAVDNSLTNYEDRINNFKWSTYENER